MSKRQNQYELPREIERYLASLSKLYAKDGKRQLQEIIVNSQTRVVEEWSTDNWNGGRYGHALYLVLPESIFLNIAKKRSAIQEQIAEDLNDIHNVQNEFIAEVFLEMEASEDSDWRQESGLLLTSTRVVAPEASRRIWGKQGFRLFLSHKAEFKRETAALKENLEFYGISSFVAHEDIQPTKAWQDEIENALITMDAFAALMTENFHDSNWTDQEVGFAFARGIPIIAVKLGKDPYGFIGKFQALSCTWEEAPKEIVRLLIKHDRMLNAFINAVQACNSFDDGNRYAELFPEIDELTDQQADALVAAFNNNAQVGGSFGFTGEKPRRHGDGLLAHLKRLNGRKYKLTTSGEIKVIN